MTFPLFWRSDCVMFQKQQSNIIDCDVSEAKHVPFLVLANKLFVVFSMGMPLAPQKKQNSSF